MLRDDRTDGGDRLPASRNVLGEPLEICLIKPMTGFYRDGCCNTGREDAGSHTVCAVVTSAFLEFSKSRGNDLSTLFMLAQASISVPSTEKCSLDKSKPPKGGEPVAVLAEHGCKPLGRDARP